MRVLRMDDVGAASKQYEQYARLPWMIGGKRVPGPSFLQWGPLKRWSYLKGWGPYEELSAAVWRDIIGLLERYEAKLTVGVTAGWVERDGLITPFSEKFAEVAEVLREPVEAGVIEIANHGLTHCVVEGGKFLPQRWRGNREYHREFGGEVGLDVQRAHLKRSQRILEETFATKVVTFVPPGGLWMEETEVMAAEAGLRFLSADERRAPTGTTRNGLRYVGTEVVRDFHDREIVLYGIEWLKNLLEAERGGLFMTVREYFEDERIN